MPGSEQTADDTVFVYVDLLGGGNLRQTGHGHDITGKRDDEAGAGGDLQIAHGDTEAAWCAELLGIV